MIRHNLSSEFRRGQESNQGWNNDWHRLIGTTRTETVEHTVEHQIWYFQVYVEFTNDYCNSTSVTSGTEILRTPGQYHSVNTSSYMSSVPLGSGSDGHLRDWRVSETQTVEQIRRHPGNGPELPGNTRHTIYIDSRNVVLCLLWESPTPASLKLFPCKWLTPVSTPLVVPFNFVGLWSLSSLCNGDPDFPVPLWPF